MPRMWDVVRVVENYEPLDDASDEETNTGDCRLPTSEAPVARQISDQHGFGREHATMSCDLQPASHVAQVPLAGVRSELCM